MSCFIFAVVQNIFKYNDILKDKTYQDVKLLMAAPPSEKWVGTYAYNQYYALIQNATHIHHLELYRDSTAILWGFKNRPQYYENYISAKGIAVFDIGSLHIYSSYIYNDMTCNQYNIDIGSHYIEIDLAVQAFENALQQYGKFETTIDSLLRVIDQLRVAKEEYFLHDQDTYSQLVRCDFEDKQTGMICRTYIHIDKEKIDNAITKSKRIFDDTWLNITESFMIEARDYFESYIYTLESGEKINGHIDTVILCGGGSNMDCIVELCVKIFKETHILRLTNTMYAVSDSLGYLA